LLLSGLNFPADLRRLPSARLPGVAGELRGFLLDVVSIRGGRLAAALEAVELPIALHCAYRTSAFSHRVPGPIHRARLA
jgi:1-deoxy-D-xylulose-5-phosphate synthase